MQHNTIRKELRIQRARLEPILRQKSREVWLKDDDRNSKFFHMSLTVRCRRNRIPSIKERRKWIQDHISISNYFNMQFKELYQSSLPTILDEIKRLGQIYVSKQDNVNILCIAQEKEIRKRVEQLHPLKSLDWMASLEFFYKKYWSVVKDRIIKFVQECFRLRHMPHSFNIIFFVLIPKTKHPYCFNHYRPISLCNFVYKVLSKIITERLRSIIRKIISPNQ